jgi:hypothetical protein
MTRRELAERMDSDEFSGWLAYDRVEPLPDPYWIGAMQAMVAARTLGAKGVKLDDFLPRRLEAPRRQDPREIFARLSAWATGHNARLAGAPAPIPPATPAPQPVVRLL